MTKREGVDLGLSWTPEMRLTAPATYFVVMQADGQWMLQYVQADQVIRLGVYASRDEARAALLTDTVQDKIRLGQTR